MNSIGSATPAIPVFTTSAFVGTPDRMLFIIGTHFSVASNLGSPALCGCLFGSNSCLRPMLIRITVKRTLLVLARALPRLR
jgi:hypothetical protein